MNGATGQIYGSNLSLQNFRNSDSSGSTRSTGTLENWSRKNPIPKIRTNSSDSTVSKSVSPPMIQIHRENESTTRV